MANNSYILKHKIEFSADFVNRSIAEMLDEQYVSKSNRIDTTGYVTQFNLIKATFEREPLKALQKIDIAIRLSLIDLFYTTNFNRFAEFGLEELTEVIWNLCSNVQGHHSDAIFVSKIESFVRDCYSDHAKARKSEVFVNLFASSVKFGIAKVNETSEGYAAQSLISKYLFFLLENHHSDGNTLGYPIYDSIALDLQNPLIKKLGKKSVRGRDMVDYVGKMMVILDCLKDSSDIHSSVWEMPSSVCNTQFALLDYFLWRIGKSGKFSFSLLWSRNEKNKHYTAANNLKNKISADFQKDYNSLPSRFKLWHNIYKSIKE